MLSMAADVSAVNILSRLVQALADDVEQAVGDELLARRLGVAQGPIEEQRGQTVNGGPRGFVETIAAVGGEHVGSHEFVDAANQDLERMVFYHS